MDQAGFEPTYSDHEPEKLPLLYFAFKNIVYREKILSKKGLEPLNFTS